MTNISIDFGKNWDKDNVSLNLTSQVLECALFLQASMGEEDTVNF